MDSHAVFCGRTSVCGSDDHRGDHVQEDGYLQYRYRTLHRMALSALGDQTLLESVCRFGQDQALVDRYDAADHCHRLCLHRLCHTHLIILPAHPGSLLAGGLHFGNA